MHKVKFWFAMMTWLISPDWALGQDSCLLTADPGFALDSPAIDQCWGGSVGIWSDFAVVGAPGCDGWAEPGSVRIYRRVDGEWELAQELIPSTSLPGDEFGFALNAGFRLTMTSPPVLVRRVTVSSPGISTVFVFEEDASSGIWSEVADLSQPDPEFGLALAGSGSEVFVTSSTQVYRYPWNTTTETFSAPLSGVLPSAAAGENVKTIPNGLVVGGDGFPAPGSGVYLYQQVGTSLVLQSELTPQTQPVGATFGESISAINSTVAIGGSCGEAWVFDIDASSGTWTEVFHRDPDSCVIPYPTTVALELTPDGHLLAVGFAQEGPVTQPVRLFEEISAGPYQEALPSRDYCRIQRSIGFRHPLRLASTVSYLETVPEALAKGTLCCSHPRPTQQYSRPVSLRGH